MKLLSDGEFMAVCRLLVIADRQLLQQAVHCVLWDEKLRRRSEPAMAAEMRRLPDTLRTLEARRLAELPS